MVESRPSAPTTRPALMVEVCPSRAATRMPAMRPSFSTRPVTRVCRRTSTPSAHAFSTRITSSERRRTQSIGTLGSPSRTRGGPEKSTSSKRMWQLVTGGAFIASTSSKMPSFSITSMPLTWNMCVESASLGKPAWSTTHTERPARLRKMASGDPAQRAPTITTSKCSLESEVAIRTYSLLVYPPRSTAPPRLAPRRSGRLGRHVRARGGGLGVGRRLRLELGYPRPAAADGRNYREEHEAVPDEDEPHEQARQEVDVRHPYLRRLARHPRGADQVHNDQVCPRHEEHPAVAEHVRDALQGQELKERRRRVAEPEGRNQIHVDEAERERQHEPGEPEVGPARAREHDQRQPADGGQHHHDVIEAIRK